MKKKPGIGIIGCRGYRISVDSRPNPTGDFCVIKNPRFAHAGSSFGRVVGWIAGRGRIISDPSVMAEAQTLISGL